MGFVYPEPDLRPDERILWSRTVSRCVARRNAVPGTLVLTDQRLIFQPSRAARRRHDALEWPARDCLRVETVDRTGTPYDGGMRQRIKIMLANGTGDLYVVKHVDDAAAAFAEALRYLQYG